VSAAPETVSAAPEPVSAGTRTRPGRWARVAQGWRRYFRVAGLLQPYLVGRRFALVQGLLLSLVYTATRLFEPFPLKLIVDWVLLGHAVPELLQPLVAGGDRWPLLLLLGGLIVAVAFVRGQVYYLRRVAMARVSIEATSALRVDLYEHIQHLPLSFHDRRRTGDLVVRLTSDIAMLRQAFVALPVEVAETVLFMTGMAVVMFVMDWRLALPALALLPIVALLVRSFHRPMRGAIRKQREREGQLATLAAESLGAIRVVQGFRAERREVERFGGAARRDVRSGMKASKLEARMRWAAELAVSLVTALVVVLAARSIMRGAMSVGDLIVFVMYLKLFARPLQQVSRSTERMIRAATAGDRVLRILQVEPEVKDRPDAVPAPRFQGEIAWRNVSFGYEAGSKVLDGLDLVVKPGERVAIVGPTGAGKSTLASLIPRFYDPTSGQVTIDGRDVREFTLESLRKQVTIVFQEPVLFAATVAENIAYGRPGATMEQIEEAARRARVDRVIGRLANGYATRIGERGGTLSGGQRQCIAIARAMIRNAPILIMDELTAGLDEKARRRVMKALQRLMRGRTIVVITHDPRNFVGLDRILHLQDGRIAGESTAATAPPAALERGITT
jgi:ATP-binding cassette subfamily B protein